MTAPAAPAAALAGAVALIAGATGPIGLATTRALLARGVRVALLSRSNGPAAASLVGEYGDDLAIALQADLGDPATVDAAVRSIEERFGPIGVLVNAAHGRQPPIGVADATVERIRGELDSVVGHAALCARVIPGMRAQGFGRIVFVSGALMARPVPGFGPYAAAKAAATTLTRYLAIEEGRNGILTGIVAPGRVVDPGDDLTPTPEMAEAARRLQERLALPDFPTSAQIADAILALVETDALTGQILWVTGGEPIWS